MLWYVAIISCITGISVFFIRFYMLYDWIIYWTICQLKPRYLLRYGGTARGVKPKTQHQSSSRIDIYRQLV